MLDELDALVALANNGTMRKAALAIHVTQSAVSKRISNLEYTLGKKLIEPRGRRVELTPFALTILERARPLLFGLKQLVVEESTEARSNLKIDLSGSVLISWGAQALAEVGKTLPDLEFQVSTYHASVAVERVRSGETMVALVQGESTIAPDLSFLPVVSERIVIVPSGLKKLSFPRTGELPVIAIEEHTEAWRFMERGAKEIEKRHGGMIGPTSRLQSFSAIAQMARAGFGHGLVPEQVALALGIPAAKLLIPPQPGMWVPVSLIGRRSTLARPVVQRFYEALRKNVARSKK